MDKQKYARIRRWLWTLLAGLALFTVACKHDFSKIDFPDGSTKYTEDGGGGYAGYNSFQKCGNGTVEGSEECDGLDLQKRTCLKLGYSGGTLTCNSYSCTYNTTGCYGGGYGGTIYSSAGRGGNSGYIGYGGSGGLGGLGGSGGTDVKKTCMTDASVGSDSATCKSCLCSSCPAQILKCDTDCWERVGCLMRVCRNASNLVNCANSSPPACTNSSTGASVVSTNSINAAIGFFNNGCLTCMSDCKPSEWRCIGRKVTTDAEVTALNGCEIIEGDLQIVGSGLTDISSLNSIRSINGSLIIENTSVHDISGLSNLTAIIGSLTISNNQSFNELGGLNQLASVKGAITVTGNPNLYDLTGLGGISTADSLNIQSNGMLNKLGFGKLVSVTNSLIIVNNTNVRALCCFDRLAEIGGDLKISENGALSDFGGLNALTQIKGSLILESNGSLAAGAPSTNALFTGLTKLVSGLTIVKNPRLDTCVIDHFVQGLVNNGYAGTPVICGNYPTPVALGANTTIRTDGGPLCGYKDCL